MPRVANAASTTRRLAIMNLAIRCLEADLVDTAKRDSAIHTREAFPQVLSSAKYNTVALPGQLFYSTRIPVCLWFLAKSKAETCGLAA